jgi:hypothetical protein
LSTNDLLDEFHIQIIPTIICLIRFAYRNNLQVASLLSLPAIFPIHSSSLISSFFTLWTLWMSKCVSRCCSAI